jgi:hypothetical protein
MLHRTAKLSRNLFAALALTAAVGAYAHDASACGGGWEPAEMIDHRPMGVAMAEKQIAEGNYNGAAATVLRVIPHIANYKNGSKADIVNRAMRVLAVATARSDGAFKFEREVPNELHGTWLGKDKSERAANLEWAVSTLRHVNEWKKDDAVVQSELGEALAKVDGQRDEARTLLEKLAKKDVLTSPHAYRALADLRAAKGDSDGRLAALERCRAMTKDAALCGAAKASGRS